MLKTILSHVREYKRASIVTPIMMLLEVIMETLIPFLMASIIDDGVNMQDMGHIWKMGALMIVCALVSLFAGIMGGKYGAKASAGLAKNLRKSMYDTIQTYSFANIDKFSTSGLVTRLTTDVTNVQNSYQMILRMAMRAPLTIIATMCMAFYISPRIASIYLGAIVLLAIVLFLLIRRTMGYFKVAFPKYDLLNESVQENVSAIRVVKAYVREEDEKKKFRIASDAINKIFSKAEKIIALNGPIMGFTVYSCILLISWVGANLIVKSGGAELSTGNLMSLLTYCMSILMSLMILSMIFVMLTMSAASAERIAEVINEKPSLTNPENPVYEIRDGSISFEHVDFKYKSESEGFVLKDIDLDIRSGETIGVIGSTGSAKTSLVNLIGRLYDVTDGSVKVGGRDVREYDIESLRNEVSVVLQKNVLFSGTILDNLRWGNKEATLEECKKACELACADEFIEKMPDGYNTWIEQGGSNVSGGQKQRLCIARALLKNPKILILDDSTSAVDTATDSKIRKAFTEFIPDTTKIIIAQRISSVMNSDRIIVMDDGIVSAFGTHEELLKASEIYRDVFESQNGGSGDFDENGGDIDG